MMNKAHKSSFIPYYTKLAYDGQEDSQLEAAKAFGRYCDDLSKQRRLVKEGGIEALLFLTRSDHSPVVQQAMQALTTLCSNKEFVRDIAIERDCFNVLADLVSHHDVKVKIMSARCIGYLGQHAFCTKKLVSQGALLPLLGLLRLGQNTPLLLEACAAVSKLQLNYDYALRIVAIWGLKPLKELIREYDSKINELSEKSDHERGSIRKFNDTRDLYNEMMVSFAKVLKNYSSCEKIAVSMVQEPSVDILLEVNTILLKFNYSKVRKIAANTCYNITSHNQARKFVIRDEVLKEWIEYQDSNNYEARYYISKALNNLCEQADSEEEIEILRSTVSRYATVSFMENMVKSLGCTSIQKMAMQVLTQENWISRDKGCQFSPSFVITLIETTKATLDLEIKRECSEAIHQFSRLRAFHEIIVNSASEMLVPHLTFKDISSKAWAVKTLAQVGQSTALLSKLKSFGIVSAAFKCFLMTSLQRPLEHEILESCVKILAVLSPFHELRHDMIQVEGGKGFQKLIDVFDKSMLSKNYGLLTSCLKIFVSYVNSANKESSGNANLKLISEKRLYKLISEFSLSENIQTHSTVVELLLAYAQHNNVPIVDFWEHIVEKLIEELKCNGNYNMKILQRDEVMKAMNTILRKDYIMNQLQPNVIVPELIEMFLRTRPVSVLKFHAASSLLIFAKSAPRETEQILPKYDKRLTSNMQELSLSFGISILDFNSVDNAVNNLERYLVKFESERKRRIRKFLIINKLKRALLKISRFEKSTTENALKLRLLLREASENEEKELENNSSVTDVALLKHTHHYDDELASVMFRSYHQPNSSQTGKRLKELMLNNYKPTGFLHQQEAVEPGTPKKSKTDPASIHKHLASTSSVQRTVSYNPQQHRKNKQMKEKRSVAKAAEKRYEEMARDQKDEHMKDRNTPKLIPYTKITYKPREERKREEISDRIKSRYLRRSVNLNLVEYN